MTGELPDAPLADIADYVAHHVVQDESSIAAARLCLSDGLACALEALDHPECVRLLGPLVAGTVVPHGARVPGTAYALDPATAAFDLACMIRWLDYNDACSGALTTHPSDNIGGILMVADHLTRARVASKAQPLVMRDVFAAIVKAYEIQGGLGLKNDFRKYGIDQPLLTRVASAAVLTGMMGGSRTEVLNAVSHAFIDTSLSVVRNAPNIGPRKNWATADAIHAAVRLAAMAVKGEPGYPWVLTAPELGFYAARCNGEPLVFPASYGESIIRQCMFKFVPAGMHGQTAAESAFRLHPAVRERLDDIERIDIRAHRALMRIMDKPGPLRNAADRDHCVQYIVALGLLHGKIDPDDFEDAYASDPRIDALRARMNLEEEPRYTRDFSDPEKRSSANAVRVHFRDGTSTALVEIDYPAGHPRRRAEALPWLREKFEGTLRRRFSPQRCMDVLAVCDDARRFDAMPVSEFVDMLAVEA